MKSKFCIVGAGIAGITLARKLDDTVIVEKSRGIGGRIASRRLDAYTLNHGPEELHHPNNDEIILDPHSWIKNEAEGLIIHKSWEVSHLELLEDRIRVISNQGQFIESDKIILTLPAPQAHMVLERSKFSVDFLLSVRYKRVIQFMLMADSSTDIKGLEEYTVTKRIKPLQEGMYLALIEFKDHYLEKFFEKDKEEIKSFLVNRISHPLDCHVHKWRYSEVLSPIEPKFQTILKDKNIFLAGDYFGLNGVASSLESVKNIFSKLSQLTF